MYTGIMDSAINNLNQSNQQLDALRQKSVANNNVAQYQQALQGTQDDTLNQIKNSSPETYAMMLKKGIVKEAKPSLAMILKGMFGGI